MNNDDKTYKIYICGTGFEVSEKEYKEYYRNLEHSKYLHKEEHNPAFVESTPNFV